LLLGCSLIRKASGGRVGAIPRNFPPVAALYPQRIPMPEPSDPDADLMLRVQRGDLAAFAELVEKHRQGVMNFVCRTLGDPAESEDIAQTVFVQVFKAAARYSATARFRTWLYTIARNLCLNELRRRARHRADSLDLDPDDEPGAYRPEPVARAPHAGDALLQHELDTKVEEAIRALPEKQRTALLLCREDELSYEEIARVLGCSVSATKSIIHRGREAIKLVLKPYLRDGAWREPRGQLSVPSGFPTPD
jgi:RNA polymerase sigma-70 factor (ECF subfamily)